MQFLVTDTGIGIPPEHQQMIFENFSQVDASTTRPYGGTGLGLSLAQHFVSLLGGKIQLESALGVGSRFYFTLDFLFPLAAPSPKQIRKQDHSALSNPKPLTSFAGKRMLLVEDDPINQHVVMLMLERLGVDVTLANDGAEGVRAFDQGNFDLILMDVLMPNMDGLTATAHIRHLERSRGGKTPILAFTAKALPSDLDQCLASGMDDVLTKPLDLDHLQERLNHWLDVAPFAYL